MAIRLGILGGGQLARMLAQAASRLGVESIVLCENETDPAAQVCTRFYLKAERTAFFGAVDVVTFENEFVSVPELQMTGARFLPALESMATLQDKLRQKDLLRHLSVPTPSYKVLTSPEALSSERESYVLKWATLGYDGKGTFIVHDTKDPTRFEEAKAWVKSALEMGRKVYLERFVPFRFEGATLAARTEEGAFEAYPMVRSRQSKGVCEAVWGPQAEGTSVVRALKDHRRIMDALGYVGVMAIEWFETLDGEFLVNELAPRVHNTGHVSQDACVTDQFENHVRAVCGMELGSAKAKVASYAMRNLLATHEGMAVAPAPFVAEPEAKIHWYGKKEARPGRKMGHINLSSEQAGQAEKLVERLDRLIEAQLLSDNREETNK